MRKPHDHGPWQTIPGAGLHHGRVRDEAGKHPAQAVVAAQVLLHAVRVARERGLLGRIVRGLSPGHGLLRCPARGLHRVRDALAVEGVDHAARVTDEHEPRDVVRLAVEGHGNRGALHLGDRRIGVEAPALGAVADPAVEQRAVVELGRGAVGAQRAEADVRRAVAQREDPAVAGQQVGLALRTVPDLEMALHPLLVVTRGLEIGAHGDAHGALVHALDAESERDACAHAVSSDHQRSGVGDLVAHLAPLLVRLLRGDAGDTAGALVAHGAGHEPAFAHIGSRRARVLGELVVEARAGQRQPVAGEGVLLVPGELQAVAAAHHAQTPVGDPALLTGGGQSDQLELAHRSWGQAVAADLLAGEAGLLEGDDIEALLGQIVRGGGAARPGTHHDHIGRKFHAPSLRGARVWFRTQNTALPVQKTQASCCSIDRP